jgi:Transposase domain (DUF772)
MRGHRERSGSLFSTFCELYAAKGCPSMPPEQLLLEQLHDNLLFRWFVGLSPDDPIWHPTTFTNNRERLLNDHVMGRFLEKLMGAPKVKPLLSNEHFSVDGTFLQAWASHASLERIDRKTRSHRHQGVAREPGPQQACSSSQAARSVGPLKSSSASARCSSCSSGRA